MEFCPAVHLFPVGLQRLEKRIFMSAVLNLYQILKRIDTELLTLNSAQSAIFSAACAERLLPNYAVFSRAVKWGDPSQIRTLLDYVWDVVENKRLEHETVKAAIERCAELTPNTADFNYQFTAQALDATSCLYYALDALLGHNGNNALESAKSARFTVEHYLMSQAMFQGDEGEVETIVYQNGLWIKELKAQEYVSDSLRRYAEPSRNLIEEIRALSWNNGVSGLGLAWSDQVVH